jgi:hypothetical protein
MLLIDTNLPDLPSGHKAVFQQGEIYGVTGRSLLVFRLEAQTDTAIDLTMRARRKQAQRDDKQAPGQDKKPGK